MSTSESRRDVLKATLAVTLAGGPFGTYAFASPRRTRIGPNGKLAVAKIACGGMGETDLGEISRHADVVMVGLCDVDRDVLQNAGKDDKDPNAPNKFKDVLRFSDWREMLEKLGDKVDAVSVSTPDHSHAIASLKAIELKKHVYTQKPLARAADENRMLADAAKANPTLVTQMGTQRSARSSRRFAAELVKRGVVGKVRAMHAWTDRPAGWWPSGKPRPEGSDPIPEALAWNLWLGTAPTRPYKAQVYAPFNWRGTRDFGTGAFGDMACHILDIPYYGLDLGLPTSVTCDAPDGTTDQFPNQQTVRMQFAPTPMTAVDGLELMWFDGGRLPDFKALGLPESLKPAKDAKPDTDGRLPLPSDGAAILVGDAGVLVIPIEGQNAYAYVDGKVKLFDVAGSPSAIEVPKTTNHWHDWIDACLGRGKARAPFERAALMCEALAIGAVASRYVGKTLKYDPKAFAFEGVSDSHEHLAPTWRTGW